MLRPLLPPGLELDTVGGYGFVAVALVQTEALRPAGCRRRSGRTSFSPAIACSPLSAPPMAGACAACASCAATPTAAAWWPAATCSRTTTTTAATPTRRTTADRARVAVADRRRRRRPRRHGRSRRRRRCRRDRRSPRCARRGDSPAAAVHVRLRAGDRRHRRDRGEPHELAPEPVTIGTSSESRSSTSRIPRVHADARRRLSRLRHRLPLASRRSLSAPAEGEGPLMTQVSSTSFGSTGRSTRERR